MQNADDIQRAHDMLVGIILEPTVMDQVCDAGAQRLLIAAADVLCWVLDHDHNTTFLANLHKLEMRMNALGIRLEQLPEMVHPEGR